MINVVMKLICAASPRALLNETGVCFFFFLHVRSGDAREDGERRLVSRPWPFRPPLLSHHQRKRWHSQRAHDSTARIILTLRIPLKGRRGRPVVCGPHSETCARNQRGATELGAGGVGGTTLLPPSSPVSTLPSCFFIASQDRTFLT